MSENTTDNSILGLLNKALEATTTITSSYFQGQAAKESAKVQAAVNESTLETDKQAKISANTARNVLLIVGGTLGLILAFNTAKKLLK